MDDHDLGVIFDRDDLQFDAAAIHSQPVGPVAHCEDRLVIVHHPQRVSLANLLPPGGLSEPDWLAGHQPSLPRSIYPCNALIVGAYRCSDYVEQHWIRQHLPVPRGSSLITHPQPPPSALP